jgi:hypothetical protein
MHDAVIAYVGQSPAARTGSALEFGSRNINGSIRALFPHASSYVGVDLAEGPDVDIVADAGTVSVPGLFDTVVCCEVFEHADDLACQMIVTNAHAHLKAGGVFVATMAGPGRGEHSAIDGAGLHPGEFYRNVDRILLACWLETAGFFEYEIDQAGRDMRCTARKAA